MRGEKGRIRNRERERECGIVSANAASGFALDRGLADVVTAPGDLARLIRAGR
jgi:hypothetical protein